MMATFNLLPPEMHSSQDSDMGDEELNKMVMESEPGTTKQSTGWGVGKFNRWLKKRNISVDLKTVTSERLAEVLRKFYAEVKAEKRGNTLTPSALTGIRAAINRAIKAPPNNRSINIMGDRDFIGANEMFKARCRLYYKGNNPKPQHK